MSQYIIPDGWNPMTEPWEEGRVVNVMLADGRIFWGHYLHKSNPVAWQYPVPLEKKRRFEVLQSVHNNRKWSVFDMRVPRGPDSVCAQNIKSKEHAEAFAKYLEENEP